MKKKLVLKFGGTSLMTADRIKNAAKIVVDAKAADKEIVIVVSAMGHTTDELIKLSDEITAMPDKRELDSLMATGEQVSATLMTMALQALGCKARSFNGSQAGINTDGQFGDAKIQTIDLSMLRACLKDDLIPVITGFQGVTASGETTTLGRGGSDTTAIELAAALQAERCDIYSDVDGIYSADPRLVKSAVKLDQVSVSEMLELARNGAQVLNARSVEVARDKNIAVRVRSTFHPDDEGTLVTGKSTEFKYFTGVALNTNVNCIAIDLAKLELGADRSLRTLRRLRLRTRRHLLKLLADAGIAAEILDPLRPNPFCILLSLKKTDTVTALAVLRNADVSIRDMRANTNLAAVVLVATEITAKHKCDAVDALAQNQIPLMALAWHHQKLTLAVPLPLAEKAVNVLHARFAGITELQPYHRSSRFADDLAKGYNNKFRT